MPPERSRQQFNRSYLGGDAHYDLFSRHLGSGSLLLSPRPAPPTGVGLIAVTATRSGGLRMGLPGPWLATGWRSQGSFQCLGYRNYVDRNA